MSIKLNIRRTHGGGLSVASELGVCDRVPRADARFPSCCLKLRLADTTCGCSTVTLTQPQPPTSSTAVVLSDPTRGQVSSCCLNCRPPVQVDAPEPR